jgi:hypothetical protein
MEKTSDDNEAFFTVSINGASVQTLHGILRHNTQAQERNAWGGHAPWKRAALTVDLGSLVSLAVSVVPGQVVNGKKQRTFF